MRATCIRYDHTTTPVPMVIAKADDGVLFAQILRFAKKHNIPVVIDPAAAALLNQLPIGEAIPERLYRIVASLIVGLRRFSRDRPG